MVRGRVGSDPCHCGGLRWWWCWGCSRSRRAPGRPRSPAGALRAEISEQPWGVALTDARGRPVLSEHPGSGPGPSGTLGFRTAGVWRHATRVLSSSRDGNAYVARLATTDPLRRSERAGGARRGRRDRAARRRWPARRWRRGARHRVPRPRGRALPRLRRALQRGRPARQRASRTTWPRARTSPRSGRSSPRSCRRGASSPRDDATYFPIPWLLSTARLRRARGQRRDAATSASAATRADAWSVEVRAPPAISAAASSPGPSAGATCSRRLHARQRRAASPRAAAPWFFGPWFQPTAATTRRAARRALRERRRPGRRSPRPTSTTCPCGDQQGARPRRARAHGRGSHAARRSRSPPTSTRWSAPSYQPALRRGGRGAARSTKNALGQPYTYRYTRRDASSSSASSTSPRPAARAFYGRAARPRPSPTATTAGWRTSASTRRSTRTRPTGCPAPAMHNLYPRLYHCAAYDVRARRRSGRSPLQPLGLDRRGARARRSSGAATRRPTGASTASRPRSRNGLTMGLSGVSLGLGHRRLLRARRAPAHARAARALDPVRGRVGRDAHAGERDRACPPKAAPADHRRRRSCRTGGATRSCARSSTRTSRRRTREYRRTGLPIMRHLALAYPATRAATAREDEFLFGPGPARRAGARARARASASSICRRAAGWTSGARLRYDARRGGLDLRRARAC